LFFFDADLLIVERFEVSGFWYLGLGIWDLVFGIWFLGLGFWSFIFKAIFILYK